MKTQHLLAKQLMEFGLSEKEASVYLASLELGVAAVSEIAQIANVNRSSAYVVLESLKKKGLVNVSQDTKIQRYIAISPDFLLQEAEDRAKRTNEVKSRIQDIVPELKALHKDIKQKPKIRVFEGKSGVIACMEDSLRCREKFMRVCSSHENWLRSNYDFRKFFEEYIKKRAELGIKIRGVHPDSTMARLFKKISPAFDTSILLPKKKYLFPVEIAIYDDTIGYISPDKRGLAILIESKDLAEGMKSMFDLAFEEAKRLSKRRKM